MTRYCPDCGDPHECAAEAVREDGKTRLELAKIEANRDIRIAELGTVNVAAEAAAAVDIAEAEAVTDAAEAEGRARGMETAIGDLSGAGDAEGQADADAEPILPFPEPEAEPEAEPTPPPLETAAAPAGKKRAGWWDNYA